MPENRHSNSPHAIIHLNKSAPFSLKMVSMNRSLSMQLPHHRQLSTPMYGFHNLQLQNEADLILLKISTRSTHCIPPSTQNYNYPHQQSWLMTYFHIPNFALPIQRALLK